MIEHSDQLPFRTLEIHLPDRGKMIVRTWGSEGDSDDRPTCLLIHGHGDGGYVWAGLAQALTPRFRMLAVDLRGHGLSDWKIAGRYAAKGFVEDVKYLIAELGLTRFSIVGHSLGGYIAIEIALAFPRCVNNLVCVDYGLRMSDVAAEHGRLAFSSQFRLYSSHDEYAAFLSELRPLADQSLLRMVSAHALRSAAGTFQPACDPALSHQRAALISQNDLEQNLAALACPVLLVRGAASGTFSKEAASETLACLRYGQLMVVPAAGHGVMIDNPTGFIAVVARFLNNSAQIRSHEICFPGLGIDAT
ncbi:alpha/beta fold hydrolase [Xanthomonas arboricola]|uniref:alpha/beta fold hydrolase n=1 Tax=Xanthomonas arboricola TaxID=56448 RepID=UPI0015E46108|nr:alpha/beta hydrolase [Xanthomonas arboricola]